MGDVFEHHAWRSQHSPAAGERAHLRLRTALQPYVSTLRVLCRAAKDADERHKARFHDVTKQLTTNDACREDGPDGHEGSWRHFDVVEGKSPAAAGCARHHHVF